MKSRFLAGGWAAATALVGVCIGGHAPAAAADYQSAAEVPVAQFFALPDLRGVRISPDGTRLAAVAPIHGRGNLVVVDLATRKARGITSSSRWDVSRISWIGNHRIAFSVVDGAEASGRPTLKGYYSIDADGSDLREVFGYADNGSPRGSQIDAVVDTEGGDSPVAWVAMRERSREWPDVYKLNFRTMRHELLTFETPGRVAEWVLDTARRPRIAAREEPRPGKGKPVRTTYWHRAPQGEKWEQLFETNSFDETEDYGLCGFDNDDRTLYLTGYRGRDKAALYTFDTQTRKFSEPVVADPDVDVSCGRESLLRDPATKKVVGFTYEGGRPKNVFFDKAAAGLYQQLAAAVPGHAIVRPDDAGQRAVVATVSDLDPGTFYLFDKAKNSLELIAKSRSWVKPEQMAERQFIHYKARDGLSIPAYLTLPRGASAKGLPLIVNIHGGPQVRGYTWSEWGRWPDAQFFASRGYAVLEPEPRHSKGYGYKLYATGFKQWGQAMQDDITDGALSLVQQGIVDRSRICLYGGSYGGYATLQGLVREPDLFKCGDAFVAVTDLFLFQTVAWSDFAEDTKRNFVDNEFTLHVGDNQRDAEMFQRNSPARNAEKIKVPVMLTMGAADRRVPLIHGEVMRDALLKAGKQVEWKVYPDEGHGFNREENVVDFYTRSLRLFDTTIGKDRPK